MDPDNEIRDQNVAMLRGLKGRCPKCGSGRLFSGYLGVVDHCSNCSEPLGEYRTADAPAFFTISVVGLLLIPILWGGFAVFQPEPIVLVSYVVVIMLVLTLVMLRLMKGAVVGFFWAHRERDPGS